MTAPPQRSGQSGQVADSGSGDGTRPVTSGGADNIGAGEAFTGKQTQGGDVSGPAPVERNSDRRKSVETSREDDSAPYNLREDLSSEQSRDPS